MLGITIKIGSMLKLMPLLLLSMIMIGWRDLANANSCAAAEAARAGRAMDENARIAAELRDVVGVCSARYIELARIADGYWSDLIGLQGYVKLLRGREHAGK